MLSGFHLVPERNGRTDGQSLCRRAIKTVISSRWVMRTRMFLSFVRIEFQRRRSAFADTT